MTMKLLIVKASPNIDGFAHKIAKEYSETKKTKDWAVEIIDLYNTDMEQPFYKFEENDFYKNNPTKEILYYQDKVKKADEIVLTYPYWWGGFPAILKNWFDWNFQAGFAFKYKENGIPTGMLTNKKVKVFATCGAPKFVHIMTRTLFAHKRTIKRSIVEACGMKLIEFNLLGGFDGKGKTYKKTLNKVKKSASY